MKMIEILKEKMKKKSLNKIEEKTKKLDEINKSLKECQGSQEKKTGIGNYSKPERQRKLFKT